MRQQTMVADCNRLTKNGGERNCENKAGPTEKKWNKGEERKKVDSSDAQGIEPEDIPFDGCWSGQASSLLVGPARRSLLV